MAKKGSNDKKEAGNAKKAAVKADKDNKKAAASEAAESEKWAQGAKGKNNKKEDAEAKKVMQRENQQDKIILRINKLFIYRLPQLQRRLKPLNFW
jgi:hypothetical protein